MTHLFPMSPRRDSSPGCRLTHVVPVPQPTRPRREYRKRDFGVGYGSSSGYASDKQYARSWGELQFRFR